MKWFFVPLFLWACIAEAATNTSPSNLLSDVQTTCNNSVAGDYVQLPLAGGSVNWASALTITNNIWLLGAGTNESGTFTRITNGLGATANPYVIISATADRANGVRISSIVWVGGYSGAWKTDGAGIEFQGANPVWMNRIDRCVFRGFGLHAVGWITHAFGVIDRCTFVDNDTDIYHAIQSADGNAMWAAGPKLGTTNAMYAENNVFLRSATYNQAAADEYFYHQQAPESVIRSNIIKNLGISQQPLLDMHGAFGGFRGTLANEFYWNVVTLGNTYRYHHQRGGYQLNFTNTYTDTSSMPNFMDLDTDGGDGVTNSFYWGNTLNGSAQANSMIVVDAGGYLINSNYWTAAPSSGNGLPAGIYQNYQPLVWPHPLVSAQDSTSTAVQTALMGSGTIGAATISK